MLVLADTSIWVDHLRTGNTLLVELLDQGKILMHPSVLGELALGNLKNRSEILQFLNKLPEADVATDEEVLQAIENKRLWGQGIGWIDAHLLASTLLTSSCALWTLDAALRKIAFRAGAAFSSG